MNNKTDTNNNNNNNNIVVHLNNFKGWLEQKWPAAAFLLPGPRAIIRTFSRVLWATIRILMDSMELPIVKACHDWGCSPVAVQGPPGQGLVSSVPLLHRVHAEQGLVVWQGHRLALRGPRHEQGHREVKDLHKIELFILVQYFLYITLWCDNSWLLKYVFQSLFIFSNIQCFKAFECLKFEFYIIEIGFWTYTFILYSV